MSDDEKPPEQMSDAAAAVLTMADALSDGDALAVALAIVRPVFEDAWQNNALARLVGKILDADAATVITAKGPEFRSSGGGRPERTSPAMAAFLDDLDAAINAVVAKHKMGRHASSRRSHGVHVMPRRHRR